MFRIKFLDGSNIIFKAFSLILPVTVDTCDEYFDVSHPSWDLFNYSMLAPRVTSSTWRYIPSYLMRNLTTILSTKIMLLNILLWNVLHLLSFCCGVLDKLYSASRLIDQ